MITNLAIVFYRLSWELLLLERKNGIECKRAEDTIFYQGRTCQPRPPGRNLLRMIEVEFTLGLAHCRMHRASDQKAMGSWNVFARTFQTLNRRARRHHSVQD
jgi:hypothetical protein